MDADRGEVAVLTRVVTLAETGSTNADLLVLAQDGAGEGVWLRAERQTAGRGREGRAWQSPPGNLYASTLVRLRPNDPLGPTLALVAAVALYDAAAAFLGAPRPWLVIKWPNDLLIEGAKVAGILLERAGDAVVIGFGVNLQSAPQLDRPTVALGNVSPEDMLEELRSQLARYLVLWRERGLPAIVDDWNERALPVGTPLIAQLPNGVSVRGTTEPLAADGALILRLADGSARAIHAGDVFLVQG